MRRHNPSSRPIPSKIQPGQPVPAVNPRQTDKVKIVITIIRVVAVLSLVGFSVWDCYNIVNSYTQENRFTSVTSKNITTVFPFLTFLTVCMDYGPENPMFPTNISWRQYRYIANHIWSGDPGNWMNTSGIVNGSEWLDQAGRAAVDAYMYFMIGYMDRHGPNNTYLNITSLYLGRNISEMLTLMDSYIIDQEKRIRMKFALEQIENFYWYDRNVVSTPIESPPPDLIQVCVKLSVDKDITPQRTKLTYPLLVAPPLEDVHVPGMTLYFPGEQITVPGEPGQKIAIDIYNSAMFDNEQFPPCTTQYNSEDACLEATQMTAIQKQCRCEPLTKIPVTIKTQAHFDTGSNFCTSEQYSKCWTEAAFDLSNKKVRDKFGKGCKPCKFSKNIYTVRVTKNHDFKPVNKTEVRQMEMDLTCNDRMYVLFEDKPQYSMSQLVSQIGGDLGLYLGFSMLSVLELIICIYHVHTDHDGCDRCIGAGNTWKVGCMQKFRCFIGSKFTKGNTAVCAETKTNTKSDGRQLDEFKEIMVNQMYAMEGRLKMQIRQEIGAVEWRLRMQMREQMNATTMGPGSSASQNG